MSDIATHYGGSILAISGKDCVAIICDNRLGASSITVSKTFTRVHQITERICIGLDSFVPDTQFLLKKIEKHVSLFRLAEGRDIEPQECANLVSALLYSHRAAPLYTSPIIAGIDSNNKPYICGMDLIGCKSEPGSFVASGTAENNLVGICEVLYREEMDPEDLFTTGVQAFLNSVDRNALSGWGVECSILTPEKRIFRKVKGRCD